MNYVLEVHAHDNEINDDDDVMTVLVVDMLDDEVELEEHDMLDIQLIIADENDEIEELVV